MTPNPVVRPFRGAAAALFAVAALLVAPTAVAVPAQHGVEAPERSGIPAADRDACTRPARDDCARPDRHDCALPDRHDCALPEQDECAQTDRDAARPPAGKAESAESSSPGGEAGSGDRAVEADSGQAGSPGGKRMVATRIDAKLDVDGRLDEEAWQRADVVSDFLQREPVEGARPSERTEAMILYNDEFLYLGFVLHDSEPDRIAASDQRRDSRMDSDDTIAVAFDTFHDHQNGFLFRVNALGTKYDAQLRNEAQVNSDWDENWHAAARITDDGWQAEIAIPWKSIRFPAGSNTWGVDFRREIRRKNEDVYWSNYRQAFRFNQISQAGHLVGLENLSLGDRFRFKPFVTAGVSDRNITDNPFTENLSDVGVEDFKIQLQPGLVLDLTANTDFAQVEVDRAQVNLTRFSLFFPEKREFFLEGRDNFAFGAGGGPGDRGAPMALLFFSRRIGLSDAGEQIPIRAGAKLTGTVGNTQIGAINAQTGSIEGVPANNYSVVRLQHNLMGRSRVGMLFTNRTGGDSYNRVWGADADFTFHDHLNVSGWAARSQDSRLDEQGWSGQVGASWNDDLWTFRGDVLRIDDDFRTDLGFVLRRGIVRQSYNVGWKPRPGVDWLRQVWVFANFSQIADTEGRLESRGQSVFANFRMESGDSVNVSVSDTFERLDFPFRIAEDVTVPVGDYDFLNYRLSFDSYDGRRLGARVSANWGEFFGGERVGFDVSPSIRIGNSIQASVSYDYNDISLPGGEFTTHVVNSRFAYSFNERWLTDALVQYVNTTDRLTLFARLNYIFRGNDDIFVVYRQTSAFDGLFEGERDHQLITKMTYSFEF